MRPRHTQHPLPAFPVHSATFVAPNKLVVGGGGGSSRSGIKNKLVRRLKHSIFLCSSIFQRLYNINSERDIQVEAEYEVEDAPTSMAADVQVGGTSRL